MFFSKRCISLISSLIALSPNQVSTSQTSTSFITFTILSAIFKYWSEKQEILLLLSIREQNIMASEYEEFLGLREYLENSQKKFQIIFHLLNFFFFFHPFPRIFLCARIFGRHNVHFNEKPATKSNTSDCRVLFKVNKDTLCQEWCLPCVLFLFCFFNSNYNFFSLLISYS